MLSRLALLPLQPAQDRISSYEELFEHLRSRDPADPATLLAVGLLGSLIAVIFIGGYVLAVLRNRRIAWRQFDDIAEEKRLQPEEREILTEMARRTRPRSPADVLTTHATFERAVDVYLREHRDTEEDLVDVIRYKLGFHTLPLGWALQSTRQLHEGQRLLVGFKEQGRTRFRACILLESLNEGLLVAPHTRDDVNAFDRLSPDDPVYVRFWRRGDTEYQFRTCVLEDDDERHELVLDHSDALKRVERRDYYRLEVREPVRLIPVALSETGEVLREGPILEGTIQSVSAGGLAVTTRAEIVTDRIRVDPAHEGPVSIAGLTCLRLRSVHERALWRHVFEFEGITESTRDRLVREIFTRQVRAAG